MKYISFCLLFIVLGCPVYAGTLNLAQPFAATSTFDGIDDYVEFPDLTIQDFIISGEFSSPLVPNFDTILQIRGNIIGGSLSSGVLLRYTDLSRLQVVITYASGATYNYETPSFSLKVWHTFILSKQDLVLQLTIDGILEINELVPNANIYYSTDYRTRIGRSYYTGGEFGPFQGSIKNIKIESSSGTLMAWWPMQEGGGTKIYDVSGNNLHGDIANATLSSFWGGTQIQNLYNLHYGYELYTDGAGGEIRVPIRTDGTKITPTIAGYSKTGEVTGRGFGRTDATIGNNPAGNILQIP